MNQLLSQTRGINNVIIACTFITPSAFDSFLTLFLPFKPLLKVGYPCLFTLGWSYLQILQKRGYRLFLDFKLHDIPFTVQKSIALLKPHAGAWITVHASGGAKMIQAVQAVWPEAHQYLVAVTALTSLPDQTCQRLSGCNRLKLVHRLGSEVQPYLHNYVCSAWEAPVIKKLDPQACVFAPGVRLATTNHDDHHRVMLCSAAKNYGVDYVIVGRPITTAADPVQAFSIVHARFNHLKEEQSRTNISSHD